MEVSLVRSVYVLIRVTMEDVQRNAKGVPDVEFAKHLLRLYLSMLDEIARGLLSADIKSSTEDQLVVFDCLSLGLEDTYQYQ